MCLVQHLLIAATMNRDAAQAIEPARIGSGCVCGGRAPWREGRAPTSPAEAEAEDEEGERERAREREREYKRDRFTRDDDDRAGRQWRMRECW